MCLTWEASAAPLALLQELQQMLAAPAISSFGRTGIGHILDMLCVPTEVHLYAQMEAE